MAYKNIFEAIEKNDVEAVKTFLPEQTELRTEYGSTPLNWACVRGYIEIVRLLLGYGADIEARDNNGRTPLHWACRYGRTETALLLLDSGADIEATNQFGWTALHTVCQDCCTKSARLMLSLLLSRDANIDSQDKYGSTPLHYTCMYGRRNLSKFLIKNGADPLILDNKGRTAIDCDDILVKNKSGNKVPHNRMLVKLRAEYLNKRALDESNRTAALSSGWEMEM